MAEILDLGRGTRNPEGPSAEAASALPTNAAEQALALVRLRAQRRAAWISELKSRVTHEGPVGAYTLALQGGDTPEDEATWYAATASLAQLNERVGALQAALFEGEASPVAVLGATLGLSALELAVVVTAWAHALDPNLGEVFAHLQHAAHRRYPSASLVSRLFGHGRAQAVRPSGGLLTWRIVIENEAARGEVQPLSLDPVIVAWLGGETVLDASLVGAVRELPQQPALPSWKLDEATEAISRMGASSGYVRTVLVGTPGGGRRSMGAALAARFGLRPLAVDSDALDDANFADDFIRLQRLAALGSGALIWHGARVGRAWPRTVAAAPLCFVVVEDEDELGQAREFSDHFVQVAAPSLEERRGLWRGYVRGAEDWDPAPFEALAARHRLTIADIAKLGARAPETVEDAAQMAREATRHRLGELGKLLPCPFDWEDLVLSDALRDRLGAFAFEAEDRAEFWEDARAQRLFPRGTGLVGLLAGTPGTGKTMAAQVIAAELGLDLFRIDLATVVSKYIGETAKNLKRVFSRAARMSAVLLFDEADALFSKRTDVKDSHDRHANADTNYLLQLLEDYRGVAILATNKRNNIDPAFVRRVRYVFDFQRPDAKQRTEIWRRVVDEIAGPEVLSKLVVPLEGLANAVEITGAQIKNAVLAGMFMSRRKQQELGIRELLGGMDLELEKEGRALSGRQREQLIRYG